jgi:hypothetical protein
MGEAVSNSAKDMLWAALLFATAVASFASGGFVGIASGIMFLLFAVAAFESALES